MKRVLLILAAFLGLAAQAAPASANMVTYTLNCDSVACGSPTNYGTVTLDDMSNSGTVRVTVALAPNTFAGTGAGYAINWNILGTALDSSPALTTTLSPTAVAGYNPSHFDIMDSTNGTKTYKASPFSSDWEYAIDYNQNGGNASNDSKLIFDVTKTGGLVLTDFVPLNGFMFAVDIWQSANGPTFVVAAKVVPEPQTWLLFIAGLAGLTALVMLGRRKLARAA
jgi:hypothetical protein